MSEDDEDDGELVEGGTLSPTETENLFLYRGGPFEVSLEDGEVEVTHGCTILLAPPDEDGLRLVLEVRRPS